MNIVDVWAQIPTERMVGAPWLEPLLRWQRDRGDMQSSVSSTLDAMDAAGVDVALLSAWHGPEGSLISNDEVRQYVEQAPERFRGIATVNLARPMESVSELRALIDGRTFIGVRIVPWLWDLPPNDRRYYPIYTACAELGVPFCTQIGHTGPLRRSETGRLIPYLEDVLLDFPELTVVGGHVGFPWVPEVISLTVKFPNFYVDTSAYALHRLPAEFVEYLRGIGTKRVMFGTNWPMISPSDCLAGLDGLGLSPDQREAFLSGNAREVFWI